MNFIPEDKNEAVSVPYYDDVTTIDGWQGHSTSKSVDALKSEVIVALARLGGLVNVFQKGTFKINEQDRDGFRIDYTMEKEDGSLMRGQINIAALPVKASTRARSSADTRKNKSLRMALYMLKMALDGQWFLQQLCPGHAALVPWMLADDGETTLSQYFLREHGIKRITAGNG